METFLPDDIFEAINKLRGNLKYEYFYKPVLTYAPSGAEGEDVLYLGGKTYTVDDFDRLMQILENEFYYSQSKGFYYDVIREEESPEYYGSDKATYSLVLVVKPESRDYVELKLYLVIRAPHAILPQGVYAYEG